ncbi:MAG: DUF2892 domain-containing protein [Desulfobaccales bacterium]
MKLNVGSIDRAVRVAIGLLGIGLAVGGVSPWGWLGIVPLATGAVSFCPLYLPFGISTRKGA